MKTMTRGELAKRTGVSMATLRYYEDSGILPVPRRSSNGYRVYTEDYLVKVKFIKDAQSLGYSLKEIQATLQLLSQEDMESEALKHLYVTELKRFSCILITCSGCRLFLPGCS